MTARGNPGDRGAATLDAPPGVVTCPSENELIAFVEQRLPAGERASLVAHIDRCPLCLDGVAHLARTSGPPARTTTPTIDVGLDDHTTRADTPPAVVVARPDRLYGFPRFLDEYELLDLLGTGGMGVVFLARDTLLERKVAIKCVLRRELDANDRRRFFIEARAVARLHHPNVVTLYRAGQVDGRPYLVSEFVRGRDLNSIDRPLAPDLLLRVGIGLARGLQAAHRQGVLHRDVKPANAMLTDDGEVKLLDFGLAQLRAQPGEAPPAPRPDDPVALAPGQTARGAVFGTPLFLSPEGWRGEPTTERSDLYSLGATLYELATGAAPHDALSILEIGRLAVHRDAAPLRTVAPSVDPRFAAIVDRLLRRDPQERFPSADAALAALEGLAAESAEPVTGAAPYRGLAAFEAEHRALFFGRAQEVRQVAALLSSQPVVIVAGDSGVGKSSLCRAGVLPLAREGMIEGRPAATAVMVPGRRPLLALGAALAEALDPGGASIDPADVAERLAADPGAFDAIVGPRLDARGGLVIFIDQLEELITQADLREARAMAALLGRLGTPRPSLRVLASVRGDFLTRIAALPGLADVWGGGLYVLPPPGPAALREIVVGPARRFGFAFESEAVVDELVRTAQEAGGGLPLLEFALAELWEARDASRRVVPASALAAIGGVTGALARHADGVLRAMRPDEREAARRILGRLVSAEGLRARRTEAELGAADDRVAAQALAALVRGRLVAARDDAFELAHEALVSGWATLRGWLERDGERRAARERVAQAAAEWARLDRSPEALWSRRQLDEIARIEGLDLGTREKDFLAASTRRVRRDRLRRGGVIAGVPLALLLAYGAFALQARLGLRRQVDAHLATARPLAAEAQAKAARGDARAQAAFAAFDAGRTDEGERLWTEARAARAEAEALFGRASTALEAAVLLDRDRRDAQAAFGDALYRRALLAEHHATREGIDDLLVRVAVYAPELRRAWDAPATLVLRTDPPGAAIEAAPFEPRDGKRVPGAARPLGAAGAALTLPPGAWLLTLRADGREEVRWPITLRRGERYERAIALPARGGVPAGMVYIPAGRFLDGARDEHLRTGFFYGPPLHEVESDAFLIARDETTWRDWLVYLRALPPAAQAARMPSMGVSSSQGRLSLERDAAGRYVLELNTYRAVEGEPIRYRKRDRRAAQDWLAMPVIGVSCVDAAAYAAWLDETGRLPGARLCSEREWVRAARGGDERPYPGGDRIDPEDENLAETYAKVTEAMGPNEVGVQSRARSPFDVHDMAGNVQEWTQWNAATGICTVRGGSYYYNGVIMGRIENRQEYEPKNRDSSTGVRICARWPVAAGGH